MTKPRSMPAYSGDPEDFLDAMTFWLRNLYGLHAARELEHCIDDLRRRRRMLEHELGAAEAALEDAHVGNNCN